MKSPRTLPIYVSPFLSLREFVEQCVESVDATRRELVIRDNLPHIGVMRAAINLGLEVTIGDHDGRVCMIARCSSALAA